MVEKLICIMGPTATGKSQLAMQLAQQYPCEIISVDSAQIYSQMDIGTAKPSAEELRLVKHHLLDVCDPCEAFSTGQFVDLALKLAAQIRARGNIPLLVGGTMLYFHALQNGLAELPKANQTIRQRLNAIAEQKGWPLLHDQLREIDSATADKIHPHDSQRIQRALEVHAITGQPISQLQQQPVKRRCQFINFIVQPKTRQELHKRIEDRFKQMLAAGFLQEVESLYQRQDLNLSLPSMRSVGYRQMWQYLDGSYDYEQACYKAIVATRQLAKRQLTWLQRWQNATVLSHDAQVAIDSLAKAVDAELVS